MVDARRAVRLIVGFAMVVLAVLVIVLGISAFDENARIGHLRHRGVPVQVTVTGCVALASGTGATESGFTCTGTFTLAGHRYRDVIGGSAALRSPGDTLQAVADPKDPAVLSTVGAVKTPHSWWTAFIAPAVALLLLVTLVAVVALRAGRFAPQASLRRPRRSEAGGRTPTTDR